MKKLTAEFEKWFASVEAGDDSEWSEPKYQSREWHDYIFRRQLALGAWNKALEIALPALERQEKDERKPNHAQCCAEAGGDVSICDCVNKDWVYLAPHQPTTDTYRQIENDGWIEWGGGAEAPVAGPVEVRYRNGRESNSFDAGDYSWVSGLGGLTIIAYRVIENDGREG